MKAVTRVLAALLLILPAYYLSIYGLLALLPFAVVFYFMLPQVGERMTGRDAKIAMTLFLSSVILAWLFYGQPFSFDSLHLGVEMGLRAVSIALILISLFGSLTPSDVRRGFQKLRFYRYGNLMTLTAVQMRRLESEIRFVFYAMKQRGYFKVRNFLSSLLVFLRTSLIIAIAGAEDVHASLSSLGIDVDKTFYVKGERPFSLRDAKLLLLSLSGPAILLCEVIL